MKTLAEKQIFTYDDINRLPEGNYEIIDGERHEAIPANFEHGSLVGDFAKFLGEYLKDKGNIAVGEVGILISKNPLRVRAADVVYISKKKTPERPMGILEIAPDLIIEIISEDDTMWEMTEKVKDYLSIGVERIILVDPQTQTVSLYQKGKKEALLYNFDEEVILIEGASVKIKELMS